MRLCDIVRMLEAEVVVADTPALDGNVSGLRSSDQLSDVLSFALPGEFLLTGLIHRQVIRTAEMAELSGVCLVSGRRPDAQSVELARKIGMPLMVTACTLDEARCRLSGQAFDVKTDLADE